MDFCRCWSPDEMIFFPASKESVMTRTCCASDSSRARVRPMRIAINSASSEVMLFACALSCAITLLSFQMWATAVADLTVLTLLSEMMAMSLDEFWVSLNARLSFKEWSKSASLLGDAEEWKTVLLEKWSTNRKPGWKRIWNGSNLSLILLSLLLTSLIGLLSFVFCFWVRLARANLCWFWFLF